MRPGGAVQRRLAPPAPSKNGAATSGAGPATSHNPLFTGGHSTKKDIVGSKDQWSANPTLSFGMSTNGGYDFGDLDARLERGKDGAKPGQTYGSTGSLEDGNGLFAGAKAEGGASVSTRKGFVGPDGRTHTAYSGDAEIAGNAQAGVGLEADGMVSDEAAWLRGEKMGAAGRVEVKAGAEAEVDGSARFGLGPNVGEIDPVTGKRRELLELEASGNASGFIGARGGAKGEAYVEGLSVGAAGKADAEVAARAQAGGDLAASVNVGGLEVGVGVGGSAKAEATAGGKAEGEVKAGLASGLYGKGSAEAEAMARVSGEAHAEGSLFGTNKVSVSGNAEAGAKAGVSGVAAFGPGSIGAGGSANAFAGARASGQLSGSYGMFGVDIITLGVNGSIAAGAGAGISGGLLIKDGVLTISGELLAAAGVGGSVGGTVSIDLLAPFKMALHLLEANGVFQAENPDAWVADIIGLALGGKDAWVDRMAGQPDAEDFGTTRTTTGKAMAGAGRHGATSQSESNTSEPVQKMATLGGGPGFGGGAAARRGPEVKGGITASEAGQDLAAAHATATDAGMLAQQAIIDAMNDLKNGLANPAAALAALVKGAVSMIGGLIKEGISVAGQAAGHIGQAAGQAISALIKLIFGIVKALLSGKTPDFSGGYDQQSQSLGGRFLRDMALAKERITQVKTIRLDGAKNVIMSSLVSVASGFAESSGKGLGKARDKAAKARTKVDELAKKPIIPDGGGPPTKLDPRASQEVGEVETAIGSLTSAPKQTQSAVVTGAGDGLSKMAKDAGSAVVGPAMNEVAQKGERAFKGPKMANDQAVGAQKAKAKAAWDKVKR